MNKKNPLVHSGQDELKKKITALWNKTKKYFYFCMPLLQDVPLIKMADKPPSRVPGHVERVPTPLTSPTEKNEFHAPHKLSEDEARELDQECYERFIKVNAKHITDGQVSGSLGQG